MEITRSGILMECLEDANRELHRYSRYGNGLQPLEGYEKHFEDLNEKCRLLRAMIIENKAKEAEVKPAEVHSTRPLADWQMEIIKRDSQGRIPGPMDMDWNPWESIPKMTPDEAVLRRRYQKAEGFKPEPVTYPGGEK